MRQIKRLKAFVCALAGTALLSACSSDADEIINEAGKGYVSLSVQADAGFQTTRAASEEAYEDVNNYTVQILQGDKVVGDTCKWEYSKMPKEIELPNGDYTLKAFYGEDKAVGDEPYVEGTEDFTVKANEQKVTVACKPTSAKVSVTFDEKMNEFFSDYSVIFKTEAMSSDESCIWTTKDANKTYYLKVGKSEKIDAIIKLTNKETKQSTEQKLNITLSPGLNKSYTFEPTGGNEEEEGGTDGLGIIIKIDKTTNDKEVDIIIPSTWF